MLSALLITFFICLIIGLAFKLVHPIFEYFHYLIVSFFQSVGCSYMAARAITSVVIIVIIIAFLF